MNKFLLVVMVIVTCTINANAADSDTFIYEGIKYIVTSEEHHNVMVDSYQTTNDIEIILPSVVANESSTYTVTSIGPYAFYGSNLISISLPMSVTTIGESAFNSCESLTSITIPNSVTSVGASAFSGSMLTSITIPNSVTYIGQRAFFSCSKLTDATISNSISSIEDGLFGYCFELTSITIPDSVTSIGYAAFEYCTSLTSINIPKNVTFIGQYAFNMCCSLTDIYSFAIQPPMLEYGLENGATTFNNVTIEDVVLHIPEDAVNNYSVATIWKNFIIVNDLSASVKTFVFEGLKYAVISESNYEVTLCGDQSISETEIVVPPIVTDGSINYTVTSFDDCAFFHCKELEKVSIPNTVISIGDYAFSNCVGLEEISIPNSVKSIGKSAFISCELLKSITIPNSVTYIGDYAFCSCINLSSISIPNSITSISDGLFCCCYSITEITIPNSITSIGHGAFDGCIGLTGIIIPDSVSSIGNAAFNLCESLTQITLPNTITSINDYTFSSCKSLTSMSIPDAVTSIGENAFRECTNLDVINIPKSVIEICDFAFADCISLAEIYSLALVPPILTNSSEVFRNVPIKDVVLHVPDNEVEVYSMVDVWKEFDIIGDLFTDVNRLKENLIENAHFINFKGFRIDGNNLTNGFYIKRQGNKTTKVIVK